MHLFNSKNQQQQDELYDYSGSIVAGSTAQLCLPQSKSRSMLLICNTSSAALNIQIGLPRFIATLTNGVVTSVAVADTGFGFLFPPDISFYGGGNNGDPHNSQGGTMADWPPPSSVASALAVMSSGSISSITITNGGSGYLSAPYVHVRAQRRDWSGVGTASATSGIAIAAGATFQLNGTACPTSAISIFGGTTGQTYTAKWML